MRAFIAALLVALLVGGCSHTGMLARPGDAQEPQFHNRLRISENTDLVGV